MSDSPIVLIVDDEEPLLRLMARLVEKAGLRAITVATGTAARAQFALHRTEIACVVLDVTMPEDDGAEVLMPEFLEVRPSLRVIVTSGDAPSVDFESAMERVGAAFLRKPFAPRKLLALLEEAPARTGAAAFAPPPGSA